MVKPKHTALPWTIQEGPDPYLSILNADGTIIGFLDEGVICAGSPDEQQANADFIIHAVNNHYELLWACERALFDVARYHDRAKPPNKARIGKTERILKKAIDDARKELPEVAE